MHLNTNLKLMNKLDLGDLFLFILMLQNILFILLLINSKNNCKTGLLCILYSVFSFAINGIWITWPQCGTCDVSPGVDNEFT